MKNKRGQALIEFVMIMPVVILVIMGIFDLSNIAYRKYQLEASLDSVIGYYRSNQIDKMYVYANNEKINIQTNIEEGNMISFNVSKNVRTNTPFLSNIIGRNVKLEAKRVVYENE